MAQRKQRKPKSAEQIEAERILARANELDAVGIQKEAATLQRQQDIAIVRKNEKRDGQTAEHNSARRLDAFAAMKDSMVQGGYDACRRFEMDLLTSLGMGDRGRAMARVDCEGGLDRTDKMVMAGTRVNEVLDRLAPRDGWLLKDLIAPAIDRGTWRDHVAYISGEANWNAQGAVVRAVAVNLRDVYAAMERRAAA